MKEDDGALPSLDLRTTETFIMTNEDFIYEDIYLRLKNLKDNKSSGVDNFHPAILINCASAIAIPLTYIFKYSFNRRKCMLLGRNYKWCATRVSDWTTLVFTIYNRFAWNSKKSNQTVCK